MKFRIWRCLGILSLGVAAFFLAVMQSSYSWDYLFHALFVSYPTIFAGYVLGLIGAATFLSIEESEKKT